MGRRCRASISISGCCRTKSATSEHERSTTSSARSKASPCAARRASASSAPTAWRCCAERSRDDAAFAHAARRVREARPTAVNLGLGRRSRARRRRSIERSAGDPRRADRDRRSHRRQRARADSERVRASLRIAIPGRLRRAAAARRSASSSPRSAAGRSRASSSTRRVRCLQGSRLNYLELRQAGVEAVLIVDGAAAVTMKRAADRSRRSSGPIASRATATPRTRSEPTRWRSSAAHHGIPFYVAAPRSTFDFSSCERRRDSDRGARRRRSRGVRRHARRARRCGRLQSGVRRNAGRI